MISCSLSTCHPKSNLFNPCITFFYFACRLEGSCHIAAVLLDLEHTARINELRSYTSGQCQWIRRAKPITNSCLLQDLKLAKCEYGKQEKVYADINKFDPRSIIPDPNTLNRQLREGLQQLCSNAVGLHVLSHCPLSTVDEGTLQSYITCDENVESVEEVEAVEYSLLEITLSPYTTFKLVLLNQLTLS